MSADNGIYILHSRDGWRVVLAQCIENLYWWEIDGEMKKLDILNPKILAEYFGRSNRLNSEYEAMEEATQLYEELMDDDFCPIIEYGISYINGYENEYFPIDLITGDEYE